MGKFIKIGFLYSLSLYSKSSFKLSSINKNRIHKKKLTLCPLKIHDTTPSVLSCLLDKKVWPFPFLFYDQTAPWYRTLPPQHILIIYCNIFHPRLNP